MVRIEKSRYIQRILTLLAVCVTLFFTSLVYFGGWEVKFNTIIFYFLFVIGEIFVYALIYLLLRLKNKSYYVINKNTITQYRDNNEFIKITNDQIIDLIYIRVFWLLFSQMGAGYMFINYLNVQDDSMYCITMSLKEAKRVSRIFSKNLIIK